MDEFNSISECKFNVQKSIKSPSYYYVRLNNDLLKNVYILILGTCEYVTLYDKNDFADVMEDYSGLSGSPTLILI